MSDTDDDTGDSDYTDEKGENGEGGVEVEETELPEEESSVAEGENGREIIELLADLVGAIVSERVGEKISRVVASYEAARTRLRTLGILALAFLVFALLAAIIWLLVGVVFLAERVPVTVDPMVFGVGLVVGYALAIVAGLVYSR